MLRAELVRIAICFSKKVYESIVPLLGEPRLKTTTRESIADGEFQSSATKMHHIFKTSGYPSSCRRQIV